MRHLTLILLALLVSSPVVADQESKMNNRIDGNGNRIENNNFQIKLDSPDLSSLLNCKIEVSVERGTRRDNYRIDPRCPKNN